MYFLEQIKVQFIQTLSLKAGEGSAAIDNHFAANDVIPPAGEVSKEIQGPPTAEALAFQELNEELDAIDNDSGLVNKYTNILGNFLVKVRRGEIQGLSEEDSDFQRLLSLYKNKFEELKDMRNRGQEIEHVIAHSMSQLNSVVAKGAVGENIDDAINKAYETEVVEKEGNEEIERLEIRRDGLMGVVRENLSNIDVNGEEYSKYSSEAKIIIELAIELSSINREFDSREVGDISSDIIQLEDVQRDLGIVLNNESIPGTETASDKAKNEIEKAFLNLKENGTEIQKEIIGEKSYLDMRKGDFLRLWLEGDVDLGKIFLQSKTEGIGESGVGDTFTVNFGGNPEITKLLSAIVPISVEKIIIDGKAATRTGEREFRLEGGLPVSVQDGSEIIIQENNTEITPEQVGTRIESYRESMASNANREEFERRVNSEIEQREMNGEETDDGWLATMFKKIMNALAEAVGKDPIFEEVLEKEQELLTGYSDEDIDRIQSGGMRRFSPDGQEVLRDSEFMNGMNAMCGRLGVQRDDMLIVMQAESGLNPQAINPTSRASGLIQFMPRTAEGLGTSVSAIQNMTAVEQLKYVEKYFESYAGRMNSVADIYRVVFYPASIGKPADWVLGSQNGTANVVARQNGPGITQHSRRSDGLIDNATFDRYVAAKISQFSTVTASTGEAPGNIRNEGIGEITRGILSREREVTYKEDGTVKMTYCSKTARLNLADLGVKNPYQGTSARASFQEYNTNEISSFPPIDTNATVADLYLDASPGNTEFGHRAACFKQGGQWYVLDPYYAMGRSESQRNSPILAEDYKNYMEKSLGRRIWGAAYFK